MAVFIESVQTQLLQSLDQICAVSVKVGSMNSKVDYFNNDRIAKDNIFEELRSANRQLVDRIASLGGARSVSRGLL